MNKVEEIKFKIAITSKWGKKIKYSGMGITEIARKAGINRLTIYNAIQGKAIPTMDTINKIQGVLDAI